MKKAVIDIGTNSVKYCLAYSDRDDGTFNVLKDENEIAKLGEGLCDTGLIGPAPLERNAQAVASYVGRAREAGADEIAVVGTMALRTAKNTPVFAARVKELTGLDVRVVPGEEEALLSYAAVTSGISGAAAAKLVSFDTGGGSTEFVFGEAGNIQRKCSLNVGAIRITEKYFAKTPVAHDDLQRARDEIRRELKAGDVAPWARLLVGMGGNVTSMAAVRCGLAVYDVNVVHGSRMTINDVNAQIADYAAKSLYERKQIIGLEPKRADIILAGACIVGAAMELCEVDELTVSDWGLRQGLLCRMFKAQSALP